MRRRPTVTVVIPVHNGAATLATQLDALVAQLCDLAFDIVVVDNNSTDDTAAVAAACARHVPTLQVIRATEGASVAYARNAGAREASTDAVLFCDADDVVRPGWVAAMARGLADHDIVGGRLDVTRVNSPGVQSWTAHPPDDALATAMKWRPYATGANMGVRVSAWRELGGFDESFVGGHEEVDFAWRALDLGRSLGFVPDAVVDYRMRSDLLGVWRQRFSYGRTYAQLYARHRGAGIARSSVRHEVKVIGLFLASVVREVSTGHGTRWLAGLAWTLGRYRGDLAYRVRCPL
jgi:GT2 family glycosyltransferase